MCIETKYLYLKSHTLFKSMDETTLSSLLPLVKVCTAYRGETISYGSGELSKLYFIIKGKIKIAESNEMGEELIKDILAEGDYFGDISHYGNHPEDEYAEALTGNTILCCFKVCDFKKVLHSNPSLALTYLNKVSGKLRKLENRHADLVFRDTKARLIRFIKNWASTDGAR